MAFVRVVCSMSLVLFNLFFAVVLRAWRTEVAQACPDGEFFFLFNILYGRLYHRPASRRRADCAALPDL